MRVRVLTKLKVTRTRPRTRTKNDAHFFPYILRAPWSINQPVPRPHFRTLKRKEPVPVPVPAQFFLCFLRTHIRTKTRTFSVIFLTLKTKN